MNKTLFSLFLLCFFTAASAQSTTQRLQQAFALFEKDEQLKHAISSLYVIDAGTGQVVFEKNAQTGLAPASTQKIITSVTAFELLGKDFRYETQFYYCRGLHILNDRQFAMVPSGDPTFGSTRYASTQPKLIMDKLFAAFRSVYLDNKTSVEKFSYRLEPDPIPDGWIWQDIGNYYGAAARRFNWMENQYSIVFETAAEGTDARIRAVEPLNPGLYFDNKVMAGAPGSGDNAYIYRVQATDTILVKGSVPPDQKAFRIAGSMIQPEKFFFTQLSDYFRDVKRPFPVELDVNLYRITGGNSELARHMFSKGPMDTKLLYTHYSPTLDSIIYWFNKKSINLYGEALLQTLANRQGYGRGDTGIALLRKFWKAKGVDEDELNMYDGSGLSPLNRVTTHAQVTILKYAKTRDWFPYFLRSLPEYNGMTMKSGTISDVKGFCGYHRAKNGKEYIFSFLVNNYSGKTGSLVQKMYKVLDELK